MASNTQRLAQGTEDYNPSEVLARIAGEHDGARLLYGMVGSPAYAVECSGVCLLYAAYRKLPWEVYRCRGCSGRSRFFRLAANAEAFFVSLLNKESKDGATIES